MKDIHVDIRRAFEKLREEMGDMGYNDNNTPQPMRINLTFPNYFE